MDKQIDPKLPGAEQKNDEPLAKVTEKKSMRRMRRLSFRRFRRRNFR